jgi:hypothetical protein
MPLKNADPSGAVAVGLELEGACRVNLADLRRILQLALQEARLLRWPITLLKGWLSSPSDAICVKQEAVDHDSEHPHGAEITLPATSLAEAKEILTCILPAVTGLMRVTPSKTALQVNVGFRNGYHLQPIAFPVLLNTAKLTLVTEHLLDCLHHPCRVESHIVSQGFLDRELTGYGSNWCSHALRSVRDRSSSWNVALATAFGDLNSIASLSDSSKARSDLQEYMNGYDGSDTQAGTVHTDNFFKVNFTKALATGGPLEFRQHCGSFDRQEIEDWVDVVVAIFLYASTHTPSQVDQFQTWILPDVLNSNTAKSTLERMFHLDDRLLDRMIARRIAYDKQHAANYFRLRGTVAPPAGRDIQGREAFRLYGPKV